MEFLIGTHHQFFIDYYLSFGKQVLEQDRIGKNANMSLRSHKFYGFQTFFFMSEFLFKGVQIIGTDAVIPFLESFATSKLRSQIRNDFMAPVYFLLFVFFVLFLLGMIINFYMRILCKNNQVPFVSVLLYFLFDRPD